MDEENKTNSGIFRESSMERISTPEQLDDYICVASPGVWLVLLAIVVLLIGFIIWSSSVTIETCVSGMVSSEQGITTCYVSATYVDDGSVHSGLTVWCNDQQYTIAQINGEALDAVTTLSAYQRKVGEFTDGEWVYAMTLEPEFTDTGVFSAEIVVSTTDPISYLFRSDVTDEETAEE